MNCKEDTSLFTEFTKIITTLEQEFEGVEPAFEGGWDQYNIGEASTGHHLLVGGSRDFKPSDLLLTFGGPGL